MPYVSPFEQEAKDALEAPIEELLKKHGVHDKLQREFKKLTDEAYGNFHDCIMDWLTDNLQENIQRAAADLATKYLNALFAGDAEKARDFINDKFRHVYVRGAIVTLSDDVALRRAFAEQFKDVIAGSINADLILENKELREENMRLVNRLARGMGRCD